MQVVLQLYFDHVYMYLHSQTVIENECTEIKIHHVLYIIYIQCKMKFTFEG